MTRFVVVPQWQGSPSSRAMRLAEGAAAIRSDLPTDATIEIAVPLEAGDDQGTGIARFTSLQLVRERLIDALEELGEGAIVVGGDCAVSAGAIELAGRDVAEPLAVVWFDAHPDLNSPATSPSGASAGMVLRTMIEEGAVEAGRVFLAGARSWDPGEEEFAIERDIRTFAVDDLVNAATLVEAIATSGATRVFLHVDLDVLDPAGFGSLLDPEPFGLDPVALVDAIRAVRLRFPLAGATIAAYAPASQADAIEDAPTVLRLLAALTG